MRVVICVLILVLSGCAARYKQPSEGNSSATIKMASYFDGIGHNSYKIYNQNSCADMDKGFGLAANMTGMFGDNENSIFMVPEIPLYILAQSLYATGGNPNITYPCYNYIKFTPKKGEDYILQQAGTTTKCELNITNVATGQIVQTVKVSPVPVNCKVDARIKSTRYQSR